MERGAWRVIVPGVTKESATTEQARTCEMSEFDNVSLRVPVGGCLWVLHFLLQLLYLHL